MHMFLEKEVWLNCHIYKYMLASLKFNCHRLEAHIGCLDVVFSSLRCLLGNWGSSVVSCKAVTSETVITYLHSKR